MPGEPCATCGFVHDNPQSYSDLAKVLNILGTTLPGVCRRAANGAITAAAAGLAAGLTTEVVKRDVGHALVVAALKAQLAEKAAHIAELRRRIEQLQSRAPSILATSETPEQLMRELADRIEENSKQDPGPPAKRPPAKPKSRGKRK